MSLVVGIDIGGTKIAGVVVADDGSLVRNERVPTRAYRGGEAVLEIVIELISELRRDFDIAAIGVATGGQVDPISGTVLSANSLLPGWGGMAIGERLRDAFQLPIAVDNDVNALAIAELQMGAARSARNVVFLALGTGVGGALLIDRSIYHGARGAGGEFGHLILDTSENARFASDGMKGTLEAYCSGAGLVRTYVETSGGAPISSEEVAALAMRDPESDAAHAVAETGIWLGFALSSLAVSLDPDLIVIGGGLSSIGEPLIGPAREILRTRALPGPNLCPVVIAELGPDSAVIGAACLAQNLVRWEPDAQ